MTRIQSSNAGPVIQQTVNSNTVDSSGQKADVQKTGNGKAVDQFETMQPATSGSAKGNGSTQDTQSAATTPALSSELSRRMLESRGLVRDTGVPSSGAAALKPERPTDKPFLLDQSMPDRPQSQMPDVQEGIGLPAAGDLKWKVDGSTEPPAGFEEHTKPETRNPIEGFENNEPIGPDINQMMDGVKVGGLDGRTESDLGAGYNQRGGGSGLGGNPNEGMVSDGYKGKGGYTGPGTDVVKTMNKAAVVVGGGLGLAKTTGLGLSPGAQAVAVAAGGWALGQKIDELLPADLSDPDPEGKFGGPENSDAQPIKENNESSAPVPDPSKSDVGKKTDHGKTNQDKSKDKSTTEAKPAEKKEDSPAPPSGIGDPDNPEGSPSGKEKKEQLDKLLGGLDEHEYRVKLLTKFGAATDPSDDSSGTASGGAQRVTDPTPLVADIYEQSSSAIDKAAAAEDITAAGETRKSWEYDDSSEQ